MVAGTPSQRELGTLGWQRSEKRDKTRGVHQPEEARRRSQALASWRYYGLDVYGICSLNIITTEY